MTEEELRHQSLVMAQSLDSHGDLGNLLNNAEQIYRYLTGRSFSDEPPAAETAETFIQKLQLQHPAKGLVSFKLYNHQKTMIRMLEESTNLVINAARQMGTTSTLLAYTLYEAMTIPNHNTLWLTDTYNHTIATFEILVAMIQNSITRLRPPTTPSTNVTTLNKSMIEFDNGSKIIGRALSHDAHRGISVSRLIIENAAFISDKKLYETWQFMTPQRLGMKTVLASTPYRPCGLFYDKWTTDDPTWNKLAMPWQLHPNRDDGWINSYRRETSEARFLQEMCCEFIRLETSV